MFFNEDHLRVRKVRTTDGQNPVYENGQIQYKWVLMPLSAKKHLEDQNNYKPTILKYQIEVIKAYRGTPEPPAEDPRIAELQSKIAALEAKAISEQPVTPAPAKQTAKPKPETVTA
jgi:hypothetical protein